VRNGRGKKKLRMAKVFGWENYYMPQTTGHGERHIGGLEGKQKFCKKTIPDSKISSAVGVLKKNDYACFSLEHDLYQGKRRRIKSGTRRTRIERMSTDGLLGTRPSETKERVKPYSRTLKSAQSSEKGGKEG